MGLRSLGWIGLLSVSGFLVLGTLWVMDRTRGWETPRLDASRFKILLDASRPGDRPADCSLVAVNLRCPHCMQSLRRLLARTSRDQIVVLLVDQEHTPAPAVVGSLGATRVWWDHKGVWRHRWGHRIYGEVLRFDRAGRYLGTTPALTSCLPPNGLELADFACSRSAPG
jgi:hypothetical protein